MKLYKFFNPFASKGEECVIIKAATNVEALNEFMDEFFPHCRGLFLSKDFDRKDAIIMYESYDINCVGVVLFSQLFAINFN